MNITQTPLTETLETLRSVDNDIRAIKARLDKGIEDDKMVVLNYRVLQDAIQTRNSAIEILISIFFKGINFKDLGLDIN
ncbi:hypothetical protein ACTJKN_05325 [Pedobacter sp. 22163]|uniref:hypothetical protein n=1 Tax=Pedobacter sp. 22163 TaxID=3453883 RepID=UPI003F8388EC